MSEKLRDAYIKGIVNGSKQEQERAIKILEDLQKNINHIGNCEFKEAEKTIVMVLDKAISKIKDEVKE